MASRPAFCLQAVFLWALLLLVTVQDSAGERCPFMNCGKGRLVRETCKCLCPERWDPATNCKKLINTPAVDTDTKWPDVAFTLPAGGPETPCPDGFTRTSFRSTTSSVRWDKGYAPLQEGEGAPLELCSRNSVEKNWNVFPASGSFCVLKSKDVYCSKLFSARTFVDAPNAALTTTDDQSAADVTSKDDVAKFVICCRARTSRSWADGKGRKMKLPNSVPFRLFSANKDTCPEVEGMRVYPGFLEFKTSSKAKVVQKGNKAKPYYELTPEAIRFSQCNYQPPQYGCNRIISLNSYRTKVVIRTPSTYQDGPRQPDRRCFFHINAPSTRKITLTFKTFDMESEDILIVQPNNQWGATVQLSADSRPKPIRTSGEYLLLEWWASHVGADNKGLVMEVKLHSAMNCHEVSKGGRSYMGDHDYTEKFEPCLPWSEMTKCPNYPVDDIGKVWNLHGHSKCRDYESDALSPWCYTTKGCQKQLCDVCNYQRPYNVLPNCRALVKDPSFCQTSPFKTLCFKSCQLPQPTFDQEFCPHPKVPKDGSLLSDSKFIYDNGVRVKVLCKTNHTIVSEMLCLEGSWTKLNYACENYVSGCQDRTDTCKEVLTKFPMFCSTRETYQIAKTYCYRSCGNCETATCRAPSSDTYKAKKGTPGKTRTGRALMFVCRDGFTHQSGDLVRMCGTKGRLLGEEPVCTKQAAAFKDVNSDAIFKQSRSVSKSTLYLLDKKDNIVPIDGKITNWYAYCTQQGMINAFVFRKKGDKYTHIGTNKFMCQPNGQTVVYVTPENQVKVKAGDIVGFLTFKDGLLSAYVCSRSRKKPFKLPSKKVKNVKEAEGLTKIPKSACLTPSIGYRVSNPAPAAPAAAESETKTGAQ